MEKYLLAIDHGTESLRATIFDIKGSKIATSFCSNKTYYPKPGWVEQNVGQWKESLINAIKNTIKQSGINPKTIVSVGVAATCPTLIAMDKNNKVLRNPIMWMDVRATQEAEIISNTKCDALKCAGNNGISAEWLLCKILWMKNHEPELYRKTKTFFNHPDWIVYALTGEIQLGINSDSARNFYDDEKEGHPKDLYEKLDILEVLEKYPKKKTYIGEIVGHISKEISNATGLSTDVIVGSPGNDGYNGVIGVNAIDPGRFVLVTGSSQSIIGQINKKVFLPGLFGSFHNSIINGLYTIEGGQTSTGSILKWFKDNFISSCIEKAALNENLSVYEYLDKKTEEISPGSEGLVVLEHWQGNRCPWVDSYSRGIIRGLSLQHTPIHIYKALMEGVAYGAATILKELEKNNIAINTLIACGGATKSKTWMQIMADVTGYSIEIPKETEAVSLGSAIIAAVIAKIYPSFKQATKEMVKIEKIIKPDDEKNKIYKFYLKQYCETYLSNKDTSKMIVEYEKCKERK